MANRYWRGGAGTWNSTNTTNWSDTSGGAGGFSVPTAADDVFFDSASNATSYTVTTPGDTTSMVCRSLNVAGPASGTLSFSNTVSQVNIFGNFTHSASGVSWGASVLLSFQSTSTGNTITTNNFSFTNSATFNGIGGSWILQDNYTTASNRTVTLTNGTLDLNNKTVSCGFFNSNNSNVRTLAFGTGNITLTGNNAVIWTMGTSSGFTYTGNPTINATYSGSVGTRTFSTSGMSQANALDLNITAGSDIVSATTFRNFNFTGFTGTFNNSSRNVFGSLTLASGMTLASGTNTTTFASTSASNTITTAGLTLDFPIVFNGIGGTFEFADVLTQGSTRAFTITNGTVKLKSGATSTVGAFATSGSTQKYLQSTTAGSQATLSQASGTVTVSYLSIKDIAATGGATWNAYVDYNNVNQGNNTGWDFSNSPAIDNEFPVALRSFTQPKRF